MRQALVAQVDKVRPRRGARGLMTATLVAALLVPPTSPAAGQTSPQPLTPKDLWGGSWSVTYLPSDLRTQSTAAKCCIELQEVTEEQAWADPVAEIDYLQPYPDHLLDEAADPAARLDSKESVALAFIAAIQLLPPRQRAVLLLRDVLTWSAREVADSLECSVTSVNSALQRARTTLRSRLKTDEPEPNSGAITDVSERRMLARFMDAWERADFDALASLLKEDAVMAMPPEAQWFRGRSAIVDFFSSVPAAGRLEQIRLVPLGSNRQPAVAAYLATPGDGGHQFYGLMVLAIQNDEIVAITGFQDPGLGDYFALPSWLPPD